MDLIVNKLSKVDTRLKAPSSKSYTHRAVIIASLANGISRLYNPLISEDILSSINTSKEFGADIKFEDNFLVVTGGNLTNPNKELDLANSGTSLRFFTSISTLFEGETTLRGDSSLMQRPMKDLIDALTELNVDIKSDNGKPPITVKGGLTGGTTHIKGNVSSQYISSLLITAPLTQKGITINIKGDLISQSYINLTIDIMDKFGVKVHKEDNYYKVEPQKYLPTDYYIEGDYSSASYLLAIPAAVPGKIIINNLFKNSKQGDKLILEILDKMGLILEIEDDHVTVISPKGELRGIDIDLSNAPDLLPTVAVLGALAQGETRIYGVEHARFKETDRIETCYQELQKIGVTTEQTRDGLIIQGGINPGNLELTSHNDHRLAMAFSLIGLKHGIKINNGDAYNISYPDFLETIQKTGASIHLK